MRDTVISLLIAAVSTFGFSILFFVHPRRLFLATFGGVLTWGAYLFACHFLEGDLLPNLLAALIGAGFSELCARLTRVPVPVYMLPAVVPLVPGGKLYETMFGMVSGAYASAAQSALVTLKIALGIAGGIMVASAVGLLLRPRRRRNEKETMPGDGQTAPVVAAETDTEGNGVLDEPSSESQTV